MLKDTAGVEYHGYDFQKWHPEQSTTPYSQTTAQFLSEIRTGERVLYDQDRVIAINKPPHLPSYGSRKFAFGALELMREAYGLPDIYAAHGLDHDTSGVLLFEDRTGGRKSRLPQFFADKRVSKTYLTIVEGDVAQEISGIIAPLEKEHGNVPAEVIFPSQGNKARQAYTGISRLATLTDPVSGSDYSVLGVRLFTGRTHQIRAHMTHVIKHPIVDDALYGGSTQMVDRHLLHAWHLTMPNPDNLEDRLSFHAPIPDDFRHFIAGKQISNNISRFNQIFSQKKDNV